MEQTQVRIEHLAHTLLMDYGQGRDIDRAVSNHLPSKSGIVDMTNQFLPLLYPGYYGNSSCAAKDDLARRIEDLLYHMQQQITPVLCASIDPEAARLQALERSLDFLSQLPQVRAIAQTDVDAAFAGDPAAQSKEEILLCYPGLFAITVYRMANLLHLLQIPIIPRIMTEYAHSVTGIDIHPGATIGSHFFIDHGTGIVIGETARIQDHVKLYQGVTLGGLSTQGGRSLRAVKRHPTIEAHVTIYAGATILGGDTVIGHHSVIGANAFITESVPCCTTVTNREQPLLMKARSCPDCPKIQNK